MNYASDQSSVNDSAALLGIVRMSNGCAIPATRADGLKKREEDHHMQLICCLLHKSITSKLVSDMLLSNERDQAAAGYVQ